MIEYQITHWVKSTFSYSGTVLPRVIYRVSVLPIVTTLILCTSEGIFNSNWSQWEWSLVWIPPIGHTLVGTALGLVLVFRNNASYDRWWEGRKQWGGIVNASRNLARQARSYGGDLKTLSPLICAFPCALKHQLRSEPSHEEVTRFVGYDNNKIIQQHKNPALALNLAMSNWVNRMTHSGRINEAQAHRMEEQIGKLMDCQGACERILNTPVPFAHAIHVRQLLLVYLLTLPLVLIPILSWASIPTIFFISLGLLGIEEAGVEIEDPFGHDPNDLPLTKICNVIERDVVSTLSFEKPLSEQEEVEIGDADESGIIEVEDEGFSIF